MLMIKLEPVGERQKGFTLVELLIVIVVIAILATISVVVYSGIKERAGDAARGSSARQLQKILAIYQIDKGRYPGLSASCSSHCNMSVMEEILVPAYSDSVPTEPGGIAYAPFDSGAGYGIGLTRGGGSGWYCRYLVNPSLPPSETPTFGKETPLCE